MNVPMIEYALEWLAMNDVEEVRVRLVTASRGVRSRRVVGDRGGGRNEEGRG